ncbi:MAG: NfeD family protein [Prevotellaceae bacterium]|nr:NfeD family protein [Prevotellaceae bacterium]
MDILIIIILLIAAIVLFLVEVFVIPGVSIAGIAAGVCLVYANYHAFVHLGVTGGFVTLAISAVASIGSLVWFMRSKTLDKVALKENISSTVENEAKASVHIGDTGVATTRLALIGTAQINGEMVEVKSADGFLDEKTPIVVTRISDGVIIVQKRPVD